VEYEVIGSGKAETGVPRETRAWQEKLHRALVESLSANSMGETTTLSVHRCRFVDFTPSSITALAFPPLPLPSIKGKKKAAAVDRIPKFGPLIVGHANGNVEIYEWTGSTEAVEAPQAWVVRKVRVRSFSLWSITLKQPFPRHSQA